MRELHLGGNNVYRGAHALAASAQSWLHLERLDLSNNRIDAHGAAALARAARRWKRLQHLNLTRNDVGWKGTLALSNAAQQHEGRPCMLFDAYSWPPEAPWLRQPAVTAYNLVIWVALLTPILVLVEFFFTDSWLKLALALLGPPGSHLTAGQVSSGLSEDPAVGWLVATLRLLFRMYVSLFLGWFVDCFQFINTHAKVRLLGDMLGVWSVVFMSSVMLSDWVASCSVVLGLIWVLFCCSCFHFEAALKRRVQ